MNGMMEADQQVGTYMTLNAHYMLKLGNELNCTALDERKRVQRCKHFLKAKVNYRFKLPQKRKKSRSSHLRVNGSLVSEPAQLLEAWASHFQKLAQSQVHCNPPLDVLYKHRTTVIILKGGDLS